jgi:ubiquitin-protein ligase
MDQAGPKLSDYIKIVCSIIFVQIDWEGGYFPLTMYFSEEYPNRSSPTCKFPTGFFKLMFMIPGNYAYQFLLR